MPRYAVADCWVLDIDKLIKSGAIVPGVYQTKRLYVLEGRNHDVLSDRMVWINSWYPSRGDAGMQLFYADGSTDVIDIRCVTRGVAKRWLFAVAEGTDKVVLARKLYRPPKALYFDTRKAHNLPYPQRNLSRYDRIVNRILKLRAELGFSAEICGPFGPKPPGMQWRTYRRKCRRLKELEILRLAHLPRMRGRPPKLKTRIRAIMQFRPEIPLTSAQLRTLEIYRLLLDELEEFPHLKRMEGAG
jgi:hypothetical protein